MTDDTQKRAIDLLETMQHRSWLLGMGLIETHKILLLSSYYRVFGRND